MTPQSHLLECPLCGWPLPATIESTVDDDGHVDVIVDEADQAVIRTHLAIHTKGNGARWDGN